MQNPKLITRVFLCLSISIFSLFSIKSAFAWGQHYLVTDRALEHESMRFTNEKIPVETLEDFLSAEAKGLATLFDEYYDWLETRESKRFSRMTFDPSLPNKENFLQAARLHPDTFFALVERVLPGEVPPESPVAFEKVSPYLIDVFPLITSFRPLSPGDQVSIRSVLASFSDEPDWQMDHELWKFEKYGYGELPYGSPTGESSKAAFHMQFANENAIVRTFASHITTGMVPERVELFVRLARFALNSGHSYWGYRFLAWSMHYAQDLCQPYHSKAIPSAGFFYYLRYIFSITKKRMQEKTTQMAYNRHFLYEDFVAYSLQDSYVGTSSSSRALASFLNDGEAYLDATEPVPLVDEIMDFASEHAKVIDKTIIKAFGKKRTKDPKYNIDEDTEYEVVKVINAVPEDKAKKLLDETQKDFSMAGRATRTLVKMATPVDQMASESQ